MTMKSTDDIYFNLLEKGEKLGKLDLKAVEFDGLLHPLKVEDVTALVKCLETNTSLKSITLPSQDLTSPDASIFVNLVSSSDVPLTTFDISCNLLGPVGATTLCHALKENITLTKLSLNWVKFGEEGATQVGNLIKIFDSLKILHIANNQMNAAGAEHIGNGLKVNTSIEELRMDRNNIGDVGAKHIAWSLKVNSTISNLDLSLNRIADEGIKSLCESMILNKQCNITRLHLRLNKFTDLGIASIAKLLKSSMPLEVLNLALNRFTGSGLQLIAESLGTNKTLKTLILRSNLVGDKVKGFCEALQVNTTLTFLDFANVGLDNSGAKQFGLALAKNSTLKSLNLQRNKIGTEGLESLLGSKGIGANSSLTYLNLNANGFGSKGGSIFGDLLASNSSLLTLNIANNILGDKGVESLSTGLAKNKTLTGLDLHLNELTSVGFKALGSSLPASLQSLDLEANSINDFSPLLPAITNKDFNLAVVQLGSDEHIVPLIDALAKNDKISYFSLDRNSLSSTTAVAVDKLLDTNKTLLSIPIHGSSQPIDEKVLSSILDKLRKRNV